MGNPGSKGQATLIPRIPNLRVTITAIILLAASPAFADWSWNTEIGVLYWDGADGSYALFRELDANNQVKPDGTMFIDNLGTLYCSNCGNPQGTYPGYWYNYTDTGCPYSVQDPQGRESALWGQLSITFEPNTNNITLLLSECNGTEWSNSVYGTIN